MQRNPVPRPYGPASPPPPHLPHRWAELRRPQLSWPPEWQVVVHATQQAQQAQQQAGGPARAEACPIGLQGGGWDLGSSPQEAWLAALQQQAVAAAAPVAAARCAARPEPRQRAAAAKRKAVVSVSEEDARKKRLRGGMDTAVPVPAAVAHGPAPSKGPGTARAGNGAASRRGASGGGGGGPGSRGRGRGSSHSGCRMLNAWGESLQPGAVDSVEVGGQVFLRRVYTVEGKFRV